MKGRFKRIIALLLICSVIATTSNLSNVTLLAEENISKEVSNSVEVTPQASGDETTSETTSSESSSESSTENSSEGSSESSSEATTEEVKDPKITNASIEVENSIVDGNSIYYSDDDADVKVSFSVQDIDENDITVDNVSVNGVKPSSINKGDSGYEAMFKVSAIQDDSLILKIKGCSYTIGSTLIKDIQAPNLGGLFIGTVNINIEGKTTLETLNPNDYFYIVIADSGVGFDTTKSVLNYVKNITVSGKELDIVTSKCSITKDSITICANSEQFVKSINYSLSLTVTDRFLNSNVVSTNFRLSIEDSAYEVLEANFSDNAVYKHNSIYLPFETSDISNVSFTVDTSYAKSLWGDDFSYEVLLNGSKLEAKSSKNDVDTYVVPITKGEYCFNQTIASTSAGSNGAVGGAHRIEYAISNNSVIKNGALSYSKIYIDEEKPSVEGLSAVFNGLNLNKDTLQSFIENETWVTSIGDFTVDLEDDILISSVKLNNEELLTSDIQSVIADLKLKQKTIEDGTYPINLVVTDICGRKISESWTLKVDRTKPIISNASVDKNVANIKDSVAYFQEVPTISFSAEDKTSGISSIVVSCIDDANNTINLEVKEDNGSYTCKLSKNGIYTFTITDNAGNSKEYKLSELVSSLEDSIIIDGQPSTITATPSVLQVNGWYNKNVIYSVVFEDNELISAASVSVNDVKLDSYSSEDSSKVTLTADLSKVWSKDISEYKISYFVEDISGNTKNLSDTIYMDLEKPSIDKFIFSGNGYKEGKLNATTGDYGFYFKDGATIDVYVSDGNASSGLSHLNVKLVNKGKENIKKVQLTGGSAKINIPKEFKGTIEVSAEDNVGHVSNIVKPDGIITEDSNTAVNSIDIDISLPETPYKDSDGLDLYNDDVTISSVINSPISGLREISWGIGDTTKGSISIDNSGKLSGDTATINKTEKNLVIDLSKAIISNDNLNGVTVWVSATDRAGVESKATKKFSIDKDDPIVSVKYDKNNDSKFYNSTRTATITIQERNFNKDKVSITGSNINKASRISWTNSGDTWSANVVFSKDEDYNLIVSCVDNAGNNSNIVTGNKFTVDKTNPKVDVSWSNNNTRNGRYYNSARSATITIKEHNFNSSLINVSGGSVGGWSHNGDIHTASVSFSSNGTYKLSVSGKDKADNKLEPYSSEEFTIDLDTPMIEISGVQEGVSYKKDVNVSIRVSDDAIDTGASKISITGLRNGEIKLSGGLSSSGGVISLNNLPKEEKYDDVYTVKAYVIDMAGNSEERELTFSVNRFGSLYKFITEDTLNQYLNKSKDISITETNVDEIDVVKSKVVVLLNGDKINVPTNAVSIKYNGVKEGKHTYTYTIDKSLFTKDGKYLIQIYSTNIDGTDYNSITEEYAFVLDTSAPDIIISGLKAGDKYNEYEHNATVELKDLSGIQSFSILLNGESIDYKENNGVYSIVIPEQSSRQELTVTVTDKAGNNSEQTVKDFLITSSKITYLLNQWWFIAIIVGAIVLIVGILLLIIVLRNKKRRKIDSQLQSNLSDYYSESNTNED